MKFLFYLTIVLAKFITHIGGQAVLGGLIMRSYGRYALALRTENGEILVEHHTWYSLSRRKTLQKNFVRGFPILLETLINGIKALNRSAELMEGPKNKNSVLHTAASLFLAVLLAVLLFVLIPHVFAWSMEQFGIGGTVKSLSFHLWDGIFKVALFLLYIAAISFIPEIKNVLQYHGAEHKVIACYESGMTVNARNAKLCTRLHPRCGTSFILFVLLLAVCLHSIFVPFILFFSFSENSFIMHGVVILFKILLIIPISALAYELIRATAKRTANPFLKILSFPGLLMQILTTKEPDDKQLEVAVIALKEVVSEQHKEYFETVPYTVLDENSEQT